AAPLAALGVELVEGDITDAGAVKRAAAGCEAAIHCAALLGGASQDLAEFHAVNVVGATNVFDAAEALGMRRVVALSTGTFFDASTGAPMEQAPVLAHPSEDPYTVTKLAAFLEAHERAAAGQDIVTCHPGAIFGPGPVPERALARTSFNRVLLAALRGRLTRYLRFPVTWVLGDDVARGSIAALDDGVAGERYWLDGRPGDSISTAECCNRVCAIAGVDHRVEELDPRSEPEALAQEFGPTLVAIALAALESERPPRGNVTATSERIGYDPVGLDDGLEQLVRWLRALGRID
ncbi:MAG: NAD-dependent epimerase/dehydratase family protein, partial [Acidimicrobiia bacterium]|nr:NAD-dependent epimerase/dehydratase family protein [Acidimicrobiia bacterium]